MPVVNTTSPTAWPSAPHTSPSKRMPSSSSTYPGWRAISEDQLLDGLELRRAGALEQLEQGGLDGTHDRPRALQALQATLVVDRVARADGVGRDVHFDALREQVVHGLADAHVRLDHAHDRLLAPAQVESVRARSREHGLLDSPLVLDPQLGRAVSQSFRILLADERRDLQDARRGQQLCAGLGDAGERLIRPEALLHVDHDERGTITGEQAHQAPTTENARSREAT